jgi:hypothetical protein
MPPYVGQNAPYAPNCGPYAPYAPYAVLAMFNGPGGL